MKQSKMCKIHNTRKMVYFNNNDGETFVCPICSRIKQAKYNNAERKKTMKKEIARLKEEIKNVKAYYKKCSQPGEKLTQEQIDSMVASDIAFRKEHNCSVYGEEVEVN